MIEDTGDKRPSTKVEAVPGLPEALANITRAWQESTAATKSLEAKIDSLAKQFADVEARVARLETPTPEAA